MGQGTVPEWAIQREWGYEVWESDGIASVLVKSGTVTASSDLVRHVLTDEYHLPTWNYAGTKNNDDGSLKAVRLIGKHRGLVYTMTAERVG